MDTIYIDRRKKRPRESLLTLLGSVKITFPNVIVIEFYECKIDSSCHKVRLNNHDSVYQITIKHLL